MTDPCAVCLENIDPDLPAYTRMTLLCGHRFHVACMADWLIRAHSCPQCRCMVVEKCPPPSPWTMQFHHSVWFISLVIAISTVSRHCENTLGHLYTLFATKLAE